MAIFAVRAIMLKNYEFIFYLLLLGFFLVLLLKKQHKLNLSIGVLWCLSIWGLLHMAGGNIPAGDSVLYGMQLIPKILRYDQLVHAFGFGTTTIVAFQLLKPYLAKNINWAITLLIIVMAGMGAGALNEVLEFMMVLTLPETNVGGYYNTAWDLTFNLFGSLIGAGIVYKTYAKKT